MKFLFIDLPTIEDREDFEFSIKDMVLEHSLLQGDPNLLSLFGDKTGCNLVASSLRVIYLALLFFLDFGFTTYNNGLF
jgi:hypothetical protein